jgi:hypothetical protein
MAEVEGLWIVYFSSNLEMSGNGVLILGSDKSLLGGDIGYYYTGKYELTGSNIKAELDVIRYEPSSISVFGNLGNFHLRFEGQLSGNEFTAVGSIPNLPGLQLNVKGEKKV